MFNTIKAWYMKTFLPFEDPSHPLHHDQAAVEAAEAEMDALWAEIEDAPYQFTYTVKGPDA